MKLSIVIPAYNEEKTLATILEQVLSLDIAPAEKEIIVVDDGSSDSTPNILQEFAGKVIAIRHERNQGKGAAVRTGFASARGDYVVVQDADLEYDCRDIVRMFTIAQSENLPVVYGSRRLTMPGEHIVRGRWYYYVGGVGLTMLTNFLYGISITDEATCYKMIRRDILDKIPLVSIGFEFCPEITAKIARLGVPVKEVPIHYDPRSVDEGKKIRAKDGIIAAWTLLRYRFWNPK